MNQPTAQSVLGVLTKPRLIALGRDMDVSVPPRASKEEQISVLLGSGKIHFRELLQCLGRDDLKAACRAHALDHSGRAREQLSLRLLSARGVVTTLPPKTLFPANEVARYTPHKGDIVLCRHRQWLVEEVLPRNSQADATRVLLVCLDDDNQGRTLQVLWELELGARVHRPEAHGLGEIARIDPPRHFAAYLHALKWNAVTATDGRLFQSPFRAGIMLQAHQLVPLQKALTLPRANLFIADDVGLGKTIEAGLVLSELMLRQRVDLSLIVCPAAVCLQWRDEMWKRFGIRFEVMSRAFVARRRKERGFGINPWSTHARFIISHQLIRRPEYRDLLLVQLEARAQHGTRAKKSLLIVDEAHAAAPATARKYACDSQLTTVMRDIAPRFENRLFLSATPHNGHSNSFSALLELLDPQRFTRGVKVKGTAALEPVMVRRLKQDLREAAVMTFPERRVVQLSLTHSEGNWQLVERTWLGDRKRYSEAPPRDLGPAEPFELHLYKQLARYTEISAPKTGRGKLVFINLQKRLLSGVEAFSRTLRVHANSIKNKSNVIDFPVKADIEEVSADDEFGADDETLELFEQERIARQSRALHNSPQKALELLATMLKSADRYRYRPDSKLRALVDWISRNQCAGVRIGGPDSQWPSQRRAKKGASGYGRWNHRRLIVFTEYGDTKRYLLKMLQTAVAETEQAEERIIAFHGGMSDEQREEVQRAFNSPPAEHPVRILVATDAAREGINLQAYCADLIHYDVPWNPARMEQRNGRIDRTLQPADEVFCRYFTYSQLEDADRVLTTLVHKVEVIARELGSLGAVVMSDIEDTLEKRGITAETAESLRDLQPSSAQTVADRELECTRKRQQLLKQEVEDAAEVLERSKKVLQLDQTLLRDALDVGFELAGAKKLVSHGSLTWEKTGRSVPTFTLPQLPESWQNTLDTLRPALERDQSFWDFRKQPPLPVCFEAPPDFGNNAVHLHLQHPLVQRVLGRFIAQGFSASDLSRVTIVAHKDALVRVIAYGRLSLFGAGAARLHDELISVAARWVEGKKDPLRPFAEEGDRKAIEKLEEALRESPSLKAIPKPIQKRVRLAAPELFAQLWEPIRQEADARAMKAIEMLKARGRQEADQLRKILRGQRDGIKRRLDKRSNLRLEFGEGERQERRQLEADLKHMDNRLKHIDSEIEQEPRQIEELYRVALNRLTPVGLIVLWPQTRL